MTIKGNCLNSITCLLVLTGYLIFVPSAHAHVFAAMVCFKVPDYYQLHRQRGIDYKLIYIIEDRLLEIDVSPPVTSPRVLEAVK